MIQTLGKILDSGHQEDESQSPPRPPRIDSDGGPEG